MKGPYQRLKYDFRRVFQCPRCHRRVKLSGNVTCVQCNCSSGQADQPPAFMKLVEDEPKRPMIGFDDRAEA